MNKGKYNEDTWTVCSINTSPSTNRGGRRCITKCENKVYWVNTKPATRKMY